MSIIAKQMDFFTEIPMEQSAYVIKLAEVQSELDRTRKSAFRKITRLTEDVSDLQARMNYLEDQLSLRCYIQE
jgi:hypothetical protein